MTAPTKSILAEAEEIVGGARRQEYGHPAKNFRDVADIWSVILDKKVNPGQVILCMIALKLCRGLQGYKRDTFVDIAGYARCAEILKEEPPDV